jgi:hypothetical protein
MNIRIDHDAVPLPSGLATWGEVLDWLETDYLAQGRCITKVSFGNTEADDYREDAVCNRDLEALDEIDIESGDFDTVVQESLAQLSEEIDRLGEVGRSVVGLFEERKNDEAHAELSRYLNALGMLFGVLATDLGWVHEESGDARPALTRTLEDALGQLIAAQENGFWISVCDVIEYEVPPVLDGWKALIDRTRKHVH